MTKKTFNQKLHASGDLPKIADISDQPCAEKYGNKLLIAEPMAYNDIMAKIPKGKLTTIVDIRDYLARLAGADVTCWMTAGIFSNIVANASAEREQNPALGDGLKPVPYWRTLKKDGELSEKYPGGISAQKELLESEGHKVIQKGKRYFVENYQAKLVNLNEL